MADLRKFRLDRMKRAAKEHADTVAKLTGLHPDDLANEPIAFLRWCRFCDLMPEDHVKGALNNLERVYGAATEARWPTVHYVLVRQHYVAYARAAMARRFPKPQPADGQPF